MNYKLVKLSDDVLDQYYDKIDWVKSCWYDILTDHQKEKYEDEICFAFINWGMTLDPIRFSRYNAPWDMYSSCKNMSEDIDEFFIIHKQYINWSLVPKERYDRLQYKLRLQYEAQIAPNS